MAWPAYESGSSPRILVFRLDCAVFYIQIVTMFTNLRRQNAQEFSQIVLDLEAAAPLPPRRNRSRSPFAPCSPGASTIVADTDVFTLQPLSSDASTADPGSPGLSFDLQPDKCYWCECSQAAGVDIALVMVGNSTLPRCHICQRVDEIRFTLKTMCHRLFGPSRYLLTYLLDYAAYLVETLYNCALYGDGDCISVRPIRQRLPREPFHP